MDIIELQEDIYRPEFIYHGNDLGVSYSQEETMIKLWAPTADNVEIEIYNYYKNQEPVEVYDMFEDINGTWTVILEGNYAGKYYLFAVDFGDRVEKTVDPYAKALAPNSKMGLIVNLNNTNPANWKADSNKKLASPVD
ncbi:MAG TPA: hypothetical protein VKN64_03860, partial [Halanaerobiales bacterium]|nr:hypothetical protein [Halanaerobiales bacterium]